MTRRDPDSVTNFFISEVLEEIISNHQTKINPALIGCVNVAYDSDKGH